ncbi:MAG: S53 family peptidase [Candidatus Dormibacteria bacterium]
MDSFGYPEVASNLETFSEGYGLPLMCGMPNVTCKAGMPTFSVLMFGNRQVMAPTSSSSSNPYGPGQEQSSGWVGEVALDTQWAHTIAPEANILLVVVPTAETLGVQGFPNMMNAEQYVVDHHLANVVTQSFGASEASFSSVQSLLNLRHAFITGTEQGITFMGSSGDSGTANSLKAPVGQGGASISYPTVNWPASDPLVTAVGGTNLCTDPVTGAGLDNTTGTSPCNVSPAQHDVAWNGSGGGYSQVFARPAYQSMLPNGSTPIPAMRGVPDVSWDASCSTFVWVYIDSPSAGIPGGYYGVCGTSAASPQFAAMVALADQVAGENLGLVNVSLYELASGNSYAAYFNDVTMGNNQTSPTVPGYSASKGWDPVTGLGTPIAATLVPALAELGPHTTP